MQTTTLAYTYTVPFIYTTDYETARAGTIGSVSLVNLVEAGNKLMTHFANIASTDLADLASETGKPGSADIEYILTNSVSGSASHESIHFALETGYELSLDTRTSMLAASVEAYLSMGSVLAIILFAIFLPILFSVESSKDEIVRRFISLPRIVRMHLHREAERRGLALRSTLNADADEDDIDLDDVPDATGGGGGGGGGGADGSGFDDIFAETDWADIMAHVVDLSNTSGGASSSGLGGASLSAARLPTPAPSTAAAAAAALAFGGGRSATDAAPLLLGTTPPAGAGGAAAAAATSGAAAYSPSVLPSPGSSFMPPLPIVAAAPKETTHAASKVKVGDFRKSYLPTVNLFGMYPRTPPRSQATCARGPAAPPFSLHPALTAPPRRRRPPQTVTPALQPSSSRRCSSSSPSSPPSTSRASRR